MGMMVSIAHIVKSFYYLKLYRSRYEQLVEARSEIRIFNSNQVGRHPGQVGWFRVDRKELLKSELKAGVVGMVRGNYCLFSTGLCHSKLS